AAAAPGALRLLPRRGHRGAVALLALRLCGHARAGPAALRAGPARSLRLESRAEHGVPAGPFAHAPTPGGLEVVARPPWSAAVAQACARRRFLPDRPHARRPQAPRPAFTPSLPHRPGASLRGPGCRGHGRLRLPGRAGGARADPRGLARPRPRARGALARRPCRGLFALEPRRNPHAPRRRGRLAGARIGGLQHPDVPRGGGGGWRAARADLRPAPARRPRVLLRPRLG